MLRDAFLRASLVVASVNLRETRVFRSIPRYTASGVLLPQGIVGHAKHASKRGSSLALKNVGLRARAGFLA